MYGKKPVVAELNGGQTDNNSYLFKGGYDSILNPLYKRGVFKKGPDQFTPGWDNQKALTIFQQMLDQDVEQDRRQSRRPTTVSANGVVTALKAKGLKPIPLSGQDATAQGVQNIISGWQTMTVWKDTRVLAAKYGCGGNRAAQRQEAGPDGHGCERWWGSPAKLPAYIIPPVAITKANFRQLFNGYLKKSEVCKGEYAKYCVKPGSQQRPSARGAAR